MKFDGGIVVEAGGLGYEIVVPANSSVYLAKDHEEITVFTAMVVREDDISLYGFGHQSELETFNKLITVSGVGAKAAISLLSAMPLHELHQAITFDDAATLTRANGVGKKTAQRIVLDLKDKFGDIQTPVLPGGAVSQDIMTESTDSRAEAVNALVALGYTKGEAINAMSAIKDNDISTEEYIKLALKRLF